MTLGDDGLYHWSEVQLELEKDREEAQGYYDKLYSLIKPRLDDWLDGKRNRRIGRPLAASEAQQTEVRALHQGGKSMRKIAKATGLGLRTVCTIIGKDAGTDRTSVKRELRRHRELNRAKQATWRARKRVRDGLPKRVEAVLKNGAELLKRAGVSRAR
jgi:transposase